MSKSVMSKVAPLFAALAVALMLSPTRLSAQCVDQPRDVTLDKSVVPLKSYLCTAGSGGDAAQFRVEYYHLSDVAISLLLTNASSIQLHKTLGDTKLMPNEVSRTYGDLVKQFGVTEEVTKTQGEIVTSFTVKPGDAPAPNPDSADDSGGNTADTIGPNKLRTLLGLGGVNSMSYPAISEITALRTKTIPGNLGYYYTSDLAPPDECDKADFTCRKFGGGNLMMTMWRYMTADDMANYAANAKAYNALLLKVRKDKAAAKQEFFPTTPFDPDRLRLIKFLAAGGWPADFLILTGYYSTTTCGDSNDLPGLAGWQFASYERTVAGDAVLIENASNKPLVLGGLFGDRNGEASLRVAAASAETPANPAALDGTSGTIAPGQGVIVLTRIVFSPPATLLDDFRGYRESVDAIHAALGSSGFSGNVSAYQAPDPKDYTYGPTLTVTGATVNGTRVDFTARPVANFLQLTSTSEAGSCPYLLSWDDTDHQWVTYGKVLHNGQGEANAYTETVTFPTLRRHFRIEEREPEIAYVQSVRLIVDMRDGTTQTFSPAQTPAAASGAAEIRLMWGEAADISFAIADTLKAEDVVQTRLQVTGYYERYSNLLAQQERQAPATPLPLRVNATDAIAAPR